MMNQVAEFMKKIKRRLHIGHADSSVGKSKLLASNKQTLVTTQHPMGISNRLTVVLQQELH